MTLRRFHLLDHFLQINANSRGSHSSIEKVLPLLKIFDNFNEVYKPSNKLSLDEIIAPFSGRFKYITYNPQKPSKWGVRVFGLADSITGYCMSLIPYLGKETYQYFGMKNLDDLVLNNMKKFGMQGASLYIDNYYCHFGLAEALLYEGYNVTGTFKQRRKDVPNIIKEAVVKKIVASKKPKQTTSTINNATNDKTDIRYFESNLGIYAIKWKSKREITMLTTNHSLGYEVRDSARNRPTKRPAVVHEYNHFMRGIDRLNQRTHYIRYSLFQWYSSYNICRYSHRSKKWWKKFLYTWLGIALANCHTLYVKFFNKNITIKDFQKEVIDGLLIATNVLPLIGEGNLANDHYPTKILTGPKRCKVCYFLYGPNCSKSSYRCFKCSQEYQKDISLCVLCFGEFHDEREKYLSRRG